MFKKSMICSIISMLFILQGIIYSQDATPSKKSAGNTTGVNSPPDEDVTRDKRIPRLYKRLAAATKSLKLQPDQDGKLTFVISSGNYYDFIDRVPMVYHKKAFVYITQDRINKIVFEYYQYNMTSQVREVKTYTTTTPESEDLNSLTVEYTANTGEKEKYTVAELQKKDSQTGIITQYFSYYLALVYRLELYKDKTNNIDSGKIDRTVRLGD